jgi:hypothetical protein
MFQGNFFGDPWEVPATTAFKPNPKVVLVDETILVIKNSLSLDEIALPEYKNVKRIVIEPHVYIEPSKTNIAHFPKAVREVYVVGNVIHITSQFWNLIRPSLDVFEIDNPAYTNRYLCRDEIFFRLKRIVYNGNQYQQPCFYPTCSFEKFFPMLRATKNVNETSYYDNPKWVRMNKMRYECAYVVALCGRRVLKRDLANKIANMIFWDTNFWIRFVENKRGV